MALRPEVTPSLARMVLQRQNAAGEIKETLPLKWFCIAQCWRHETTQRGRKREHYQWNMDIVGHQGITAELELLSAVVDLFRRLKISSSDVSITINSRRVLNSVCTSYGVPADSFAAVCVVLDKLGKIGAATVKEELVSLNVPSISADKILQALSAKTVLGLLEQMMPVATDELLQACDEVTQLFALAEAYGFADFLQFDAGVVRGLAYYTGIVFECFDKNFGLRAICGGGRYDRLMSLYGSPVEVPCVGFGFGDCVIKELLEELKLMPSVEPSVDFVVGAYNQEMYAPSLKVRLSTVWLLFVVEFVLGVLFLSLYVVHHIVLGSCCLSQQVAQLLRSTGWSVHVLLTVKKASKVFDFADKIGARRVAYVAPNEWAANKVRVKDLRDAKGDAARGEDVLLEHLSLMCFDVL